MREVPDPLPSATCFLSRPLPVPYFRTVATSQPLQCSSSRNAHTHMANNNELPTTNMVIMELTGKQAWAIGFRGRVLSVLCLSLVNRAPLNMVVRPCCSRSSIACLAPILFLFLKPRFLLLSHPPFPFHSSQLPPCSAPLHHQFSYNLLGGLYLNNSEKTLTPRPSREDWRELTYRRAAFWMH